MSHHHYRLYPYEQLIPPLIHMIPSDSFHKMILNGIRLMVPMMAAPLRMSTYLNHNQKSALKLYHYRNPNFAFDVATNQIPTVQFLFDSDW